MKLRNKLVAVMAASMVVTSVPVVTMADSDNTLSIYNYNIKDTTVGFKTTKTAYQTTAPAITQIYTGKAQNGFTGYNFSVNAVPGLEITPDYTYDLTGSTQTAFVSLTKDSEFNADAYLYYIDALAGTTESTNLYFDAEGKAQQANNTAWNGQNKSAILDTLKDANGNVRFTVQYDNKDDAKDASVTITVMDMSEFKENDREYKSTLRLDFTGKFVKNEAYRIPFLCKVGGDKEVLAYLDGKDSFVSSKTFTLTGVLSDKKLVATSDSKTITVDNIEEIGEIRLDENQIGSLANAEHTWIKIKLPSSSGLEFSLNKTQNNIKATGKRGFFGQTKEKSDIKVEYGTTTRTRNNDSERDEQVLLVQLPKFEDKSAKGQIVLTGIYVEPKEKTASTGEVKVTVSEDLTRGNTVDSSKTIDLVDSTTLKVAEVADYGVTITSTPIDVKAGRSGVIADKRATFTLKESVKDSLVDSRKIEFTLENGYIFGPADVNYNKDYSSATYKQDAKKRFLELIDDETIKFEEDAEAKASENKEGFVKDSLDLEIDANGYVTGFSGRYDRLQSTEDDEIKVTLPVAAPVQAKGEIKVKAGNLFTRAHEKDAEAVIANIIEPITVEIENAALKVGLQDQKAGKITIKETDKGMFERGWLYLSAEDFENLGITFDEVPEIKVASGNMEIKNIQISRDNKVVAFEVSKTSTEASTIEISDIKFTADRTVPEANYDLQIWGDALTDENVLDVANYSLNAGRISSARAQFTDMFVVPEFITMTTKNTQDIDASGLKAATATFVINESKFTVNGESVAMDSAAYIKNNYTMVPVKYVAKAFGIEGNAVQYDQATHTATIVAGNKVIAITAGKTFITVNGTQVPMATKAEVKDGRMCVPMAYIAAALDVQKSWDATTKTATFTNQTENK